MHVYTACMTLNTLILILALIPLCLGAATFLSPRALRALAAHLISWAEGVEAFHNSRRVARGYWMRTLLPAGLSESYNPTMEQIRERLGVR